MKSNAKTVENDMTDTPQALETFMRIATMDGNKIAGFIGLTLENTEDLTLKINRFIEMLEGANYSSASFEKLREACAQLGSNEVRTSIAVCNYILDRPVESINHTLMEEAPIIQVLHELRKEMIDLDPKSHDFSSINKLLGGFSAKKRLYTYLAGYRAAQEPLSSIFERLHLDKTAMIRKNTALTKEKNNLWRLMQLLYQYAYVTEQLSEQLSRMISTSQTNPAKSEAIRIQLLHVITRKKKEIYEQLKLCTIGYLLLEMIRVNHMELIAALDQVIIDAVAAYNSAVLVEAELLEEHTLEEPVNVWRRFSKYSLGARMKILEEKAEQQQPSVPSLALLNVASENFFVEMKALWDYKWHALAEMQLGVVSFVEEADKTLNHLTKTYGEDWYGLITELSGQEVNTLVNRAVHII